MNRKEAERRLRNWADYIKIIAGIEEEIREIRLKIEHNRSLKGVSFDGMPKDSGIHKPTEEAAVKNVAVFEEEIRLAEERIRAERDRKAEVDSFIESLDSLEQKIVRLRYVKKKSWEYIAMNVYISPRTCFRRHNKILDLMCGWYKRRDEQMKKDKDRHQWEEVSAEKLKEQLDEMSKTINELYEKYIGEKTNEKG
ncbi:MAG: hypothetical protein LIO87_03145 [Eubacterium sp.]|nr:hypothetical protein [Eubacterium sp.]